MELKYLGWLRAEFAASAFAQFIDFSAGCGKCSVQPRVLRGDFRRIDDAVWDNLFGRSHQECAPDDDAGADGNALDDLHGACGVAPGSA